MLSQAYSRKLLSFLFGYIFVRRRNVLNAILYFDRHYNFAIARFLKKDTFFFFRKSEYFYLSFKQIIDFHIKYIALRIKLIPHTTVTLDSTKLI